MSLDDVFRFPPDPGAEDRIGAVVRGARILVTGAGGSVGSELCRQVLPLRPERLLLLGHGEHSLFQLERELEPPPGTRLSTVVADIRNRRRMARIIAEERPDLVLHAAAHKHVPLMEGNVAEAVSNNVDGTRSVAEGVCAVDGVAMLLLSTDKAVRPASVMGVTKAVAEGVVRRLAADRGRNLSAIRFGNVLGSRGSVVPLLDGQIRAGRPVELTDPGMRRYFITCGDAATLILEAAGLARGGELFVTVMDEPIAIRDLAEKLIRLAGKEPGRDVPICFRGARPGEKIDEERFFDESVSRPTPHPRLRLANDPLPGGSWLGEVDTLVRAASEEEGEEELRERLRRLVPEYRPEGRAAPPRR